MNTQERNTPKFFYGDRFDVADTSNLSLFLYSSSLAIIAKNANGAVIGSHLYSFHDQQDLEEVVAQDSLINSQNTSGKLYVHNEHFCLVPSVLFDPSVKETYLNFTTAFDMGQQEVFYEGVDSNNIQVVGAIEEDTIALLDKALPDLEITHGSCLALAYLCGNKSDMLGQELYVFAERGHMYLAAFTSSDLKLFNRFPVEGDQDFLKYVFAVAHQLAFDRMHCRITLLGDITGIQVDMDVLTQYFKNIHVADPQINQTYSPGAEKFKETRLLEAFWTI